MKTYLVLVGILVLASLTGCATQSGYYSPEPMGGANRTRQELRFNGSFNGTAVSNDSRVAREQMEWYRLSMEQQRLNHQQAMDRARQQQYELDAMYYRADRAVYTVDRLVRTFDQHHRWR